GWLSFLPARRGALRALHSCPTRRSSDLRVAGRARARDRGGVRGARAGPALRDGARRLRGSRLRRRLRSPDPAESLLERGEAQPRSEEHTSDSSHVKISYAVFCLKKKKNY